jgi:V/A-type H+-transporting ATPase subunit I
VFELIGILPGYREIDVSLWFLLFLQPVLRDARGRRRLRRDLPRADAMGAAQVSASGDPRAFTLLKITSVATMVWGVLTGTYFGIPDLPAPLAALKTELAG